MNLDQLNLSWWLIIVTAYACYLALLPVQRESHLEKYYNALKFIQSLYKLFALMLVAILVWVAYHQNYVYNGGNIAKITLHTCKAGGNCEYTGIVTYRPFMRELSVLTVPLYPILNCPKPNKNCIQEQIFIDKENVESITFTFIR